MTDSDLGKTFHSVLILVRSGSRPKTGRTSTMGSAEVFNFKYRLLHVTRAYDGSSCTVTEFLRSAGSLEWIRGSDGQ
jgi:hypothetical protein